MKLCSLGIALCLALLSMSTACSQAPVSKPSESKEQGKAAAPAPQETKVDSSAPDKKENGMKIATIGGGCFWCVEAVFQRLDGVEKVVSGYSGGKNPNPTYKQVCTGLTGHAEVCQIHYDPAKLEFKDILEVFWKTHDPTTVNRQGNDEGTQYRSVIFYHDDDQKRVAEEYKEKLDKSGIFKDPIVTEISPLSVFYPAEDYHQNYYNLNPNQGYCRMVVKSKVDKFKEVFGEKMKKETK